MLIACCLLSSAARVTGFTCLPANNAAQCSALAAVYASLNGPGWLNTSGWAASASNIATDLCTFAYVDCSGGSITTLCVLACFHPDFVRR